MKASLRLGKQFLILLAFILLAIGANWPAIQMNMMYPEQVVIYNANHMIHSAADLVRVYTHPKLLDYMVPFFRPTGTFLIYQLITPFIGWYNTQALIIINLAFLGICAYLIYLLYPLFFPKYKIGGYLAAALYIMNPGLTMVKFAVMHFEFLYIFFVLLSIYFFINFCQKNFSERAPNPLLRLHHLNYLLGSVIAYIIAVTCKESALMWGPVAMVYFLMSYHAAGSRTIAKKEIIYVVFLWLAISFALLFYLMLSWQQAMHPLVYGSILEKIKFTYWHFAIYIFSLRDDFSLRVLDFPMLYQPFITATTSLLTWVFTALTGITLFHIFRHNNKEFKFSAIFLLLAIGVFMILPLLWGVGLPWHLNLVFVCQSWLFGFGFEYYLRHYSGKALANSMGVVMVIMLAITTYHSDVANRKMVANSVQGFASRLNYNAVFHPPALKHKLTPATILILQDSKWLGDYPIGDSTYPALVIVRNTQFVFQDTFLMQKQLFWPLNPVYNGTLFHWAYAMPNLQEAVVPFTDSNFKYIPDTMILSWIRHINDVVCFAYDDNANWYDHTEAFRKSILREQQRRHMSLHFYHNLVATALHSDSVKFARLPYADPEICEAYCDKLKSCKGFTYINLTKGVYTLAQCSFYNKIKAEKQPCQVCTAYIKSA